MHFSINEPRQLPSKSWYSKKFNGPGLSYEIGVSVQNNQCVWIKGPERASTNDLAMFRAPNGLKSRVPPGKKVIADRIYKDDVCAIRNPQDTPEVKKFKRRARARHENFNGRLKTFKALGSTFRHGHDKHKAIFEAVCVIVQYELENGRPLFDV